MHPAIQVCVRHEGAVVVDRAVGHARGDLPGRPFDRERAVPLTVDTLVNLFSAAEAVTAMLIHKLEEQAVLDLDDPVAEHIRGFERHGKAGITIRHVLTHRAAIAPMPAEAFDPDVLADHDEVEEIVRDLRPWADPDRDIVVAPLTTGKPVIGSHLPALVRLMGSIYEVFPE
jgi:CubicO group peptidase (beta-lactamase class C family)